MNKDQVEGVAKGYAGKIQRAAGKSLGSRKQQLEGSAKEIASKAQKRYGDAEEAVRTARKEERRVARRERPS